MKPSIAPRLVLIGALVFLLAPFLVVFIAGFSGEDTLVFPPRSYSLRWIVAVFQVEGLQHAFFTSITLGVISTLLALALGIPAAYALSRFEFPGQQWVRNILTAPLIVPGIIVGLALLQNLVLTLQTPVFASLLIGHTALLLPYAVRVVSASLNNLRRDIEDAAVMLGATRAQTFRKVVLPNISGAVAAAAILSFISSFNQVPISLFLSGPGVSTLPIEMLSYMESTFDPSIAALSTLLVGFTMLIMFITEKLLGISRYV